VAASDSKSKLTQPRLECVADTAGSCAWNDVKDMSRVTFDEQTDTAIRGSRLFGSHAITVRLCAKEQLFADIPETKNHGQGPWELLKGDTFVVRVPKAAVKASLTIKASGMIGEREIAVGDSIDGTLELVGKAVPMDTYTSYTYQMRR
jgi:hypothetical protein